MRAISFLVGFMTVTATLSLGEPLNRPTRHQNPQNLPNIVKIPGMRQAVIKGPKYFRKSFLQT